MATLFIPLEPCLIENGCLQIIIKSHKLGRIDHVKPEGHDLTIIQERLRHILKNMVRIKLLRLLLMERWQLKWLCVMWLEY